MSKARAGFRDLRIQVEADTLPQAIEAVEAGADLILLDNFDDRSLVSAVKAVRAAAKQAGRTVVIEASGGITLARVPRLRTSGIDRISTSALTMGAAVIDFGLDEGVVGGDGR